MNPAEGKKGFTLIELMIVIVIIGILAAFVLPRYVNTHHNIREERTYSDCYIVQSAVENFGTQNGYYPDPNFIIHLLPGEQLLENHFTGKRTEPSTELGVPGTIIYRTVYAPDEEFNGIPIYGRPTSYVITGYDWNGELLVTLKPSNN